MRKSSCLVIARAVLSHKMQAIRRVAILRKVSAFEQISRLQLLGQVDAEESRRILSDRAVVESHDTHKSAALLVEQCVRDHTSEVRVLEQLTPEDGHWADLVISVGGDGTFLQASHAVDDSCSTPILGVNSCPQTSFGYYCSTIKDSFEQYFKKVTNGDILPMALWRMKVFLNGVPHSKLMLNDALFGGLLSADTVKYIIKYDQQSQMQKSSGVWIATSAGSTAAILSAGGVMQHLNSKRLQFRVRELFPLSVPNDVPLACGFVDEDLEIITRMTNSRLFLDGTHEMISLKFGDRLSFRPSQRPLYCYYSEINEIHRKQVLDLQASYRDRLSICMNAFDQKASSSSPTN
jgi:NAD+ kinase